jgi:RNA polymerase sigma-70 factor (ECF subfamily)
MVQTCQTCGRPLADAVRPGRAAFYCSQACRQRAYRERRQPAEIPARDLIGELGRRLDRVRLTPASTFHADVEGLSTPFAQLRRLARQAGQDEDQAQDQEQQAQEAARAEAAASRSSTAANCGCTATGCSVRTTKRRT